MTRWKFLFAVILLCAGGNLEGLFPSLAVAQEEGEVKTTTVHRKVRRMGEGSFSSIVPHRRGIRGPSAPYSERSFSHRFSRHAAYAKLKAHMQHSAAREKLPPPGRPSGANAASFVPAPPGQFSSRIAYAIYPSGLDPDVTARLRALERQIAFWTSSRSLDSLKEEQIQKFGQLLEVASGLLFSPQRHPNGATIQILFYGTNIVMKPDMRNLLGGASVARDALHSLAKDFCRMIALRVALDNPETDDAVRAAWQDELNDLLSHHFVLQTKPQSQNG